MTQTPASNKFSPQDQSQDQPAHQPQNRLAQKRNFQKEFVARFRQADPAGILFFAEAYSMVHDAYEDFVVHMGFQWKDWFENPDWAVPIRHSECNHLAPMRAGRIYELCASVDSMSETSFTIRYTIRETTSQAALIVDSDPARQAVAAGASSTSSASVVCAEVKLVHIFINKQNKTKMPIPSIVRDRLKDHQV